MSKFKFEWWVGDKFEFPREGTKHTVSLVRGNYLDVKECVLPFISGVSKPNNIKPIGKTKKRYKREKLKWQQSNIKAGDWVERIVEYDSLLKGARWSKGYRFEVSGVFGGAIHEKEFIGSHSLSSLKPCKPPKQKEPEYPTVGRFSVRDGRLMFHYGKSLADWGGFSCVDLDVLKFKPEKIKNTTGCGYFTAKDLRDVADLLDIANKDG